MAKKARGRPVNGIVLLDKAQGITSNTALQQVKRLFYAQKAGHTGSLDPLATGMLPICLGEATKFAQFLLDSDKVYEVEACWGVRTDTSDQDGEVVSTVDATHITEEMVNEVLPAFRGEISQVPSMYSALKHQGVPLYKLARQGQVIDRPARDIQVFQFDLLSHQVLDGQVSSRLHVHCSKGTYVRTLIEDIGNQLGCGGHVKALRRLTVSPFSINQMRTDDQLHALKKESFQALDDVILPMDVALSHLPAVNISTAAAYYLRQGQPIVVSGLEASGQVRLMLNDTEFFGVGEGDGVHVKPKRLLKQS